MSSFDPMAAAVDWLDAYRAADPDIANLYATDATVECCDGHTTLVGRKAIAQYWRMRFLEKPASRLEDLRANGDTVLVSYAVPGETLRVTLRFSEAGEISRSSCTPI